MNLQILVLKGLSFRSCKDLLLVARSWFPETEDSAKEDDFFIVVEGAIPLLLSYTYIILYCFNPLTPMSDQDRNSPYNINEILSRQVMRIKEDIH